MHTVTIVEQVACALNYTHVCNIEAGSDGCVADMHARVCVCSPTL